MVALSEIHLEAGQVLYREGDWDDCIYVIVSGEVFSYYVENGDQVPCDIRSEGNVIGEFSILTNSPRAVTIEALTPCLVYKISADKVREDFEKLDPVLRACVDTSINFAARFAATKGTGEDELPLSPKTLRNAADLISEFRFELDIKKGLARDEFFLVYQPIMSLADNRVAGIEALMRWRHPEHGLVPPNEFIPVAETMGSIGQLTAFALTEACAALARTNALTGSPLYASVNISGKDIDDSGFVDLLEHMVDRYDLCPGMLKLEVTETALVPDSAVAERNLARIRALGCGISIDDFGTGYSNLAYLKSLPLTAIKIDRAFAGDVSTNSVSRGIVKMLVGLGNDLDVDVIAEGLEDADTVEALKKIGCGFAQGFYFHRPMPEDALVQLLTSSRVAPNVA